MNSVDQQEQSQVLPVALSSQVVNNSCRGNSFASTRRPLDQTEGTLEYSFHSVHLNKHKHKHTLVITMATLSKTSF